MPRTARRLIDGGVYHVVTRGNNGQILFREEADSHYYLRAVAAYSQAHQVAVRHFVLMPSHVQLVLEVTRGEELSKAMLGINLVYAWFYRRRYQYRGHLWQGRFQSLLLNRATDLLACGWRVELAPVLAGLVQDPATYVWSSYRAYAEGADVPPVAPHPLYQALGATPDERRQQYRQLALEALARERARASMTGASPESNDGHGESRFGLTGLTRARGRPRKVPDTFQSGKGI